MSILIAFMDVSGSAASEEYWWALTVGRKKFEWNTIGGIVRHAENLSCRVDLGDGWQVDDLMGHFDGRC